MLKPLRLDDNAPWKQRYRAPMIAAAQLARSNPERGVVTSTETGKYQLYAWENETMGIPLLRYDKVIHLRKEVPECIILEWMDISRP